MENVEKVKRDNRAISDEFFERFKPEGDLHPFVKLVKEYEDEEKMRQPIMIPLIIIFICFKFLMELTP